MTFLRTDVIDNDVDDIGEIVDVSDPNIVEHVCRLRDAIDLNRVTRRSVSLGHPRQGGFETESANGRGQKSRQNRAKLEFHEVVTVKGGESEASGLVSLGTL